ncbi:transposase [Persicitalea sp.]|uniref:transposase n=1 Tax=Persicitalea sp. TaxID=3100273 RepID=UPI0035934FEB
MQATVKQDQQLFESFGLAKSLIGIGLIAASAFLIHTHGFMAFENGRQFACYAGVAPFEHSSGSSVRAVGRCRKTSVSHLANKKMKALLSNAAASAVQHDPQLRAYYHRKLDEGKGTRWWFSTQSEPN